MIFPVDNPNEENPKPTALFAAAAGSATANSWTSINGWAAARVYSAVSEEYEAAQSAAVIADTGPIARYAVRGPGAADFLSRITSAPVSTLEIAESARGLILDEEGAVIDIVETARLGRDLFLLTSSRPHARRLQLAARGLDATCEDISGAISALAIIGPDARDVAAAAGFDASSETLAAQGRVRGVETSVRPIHFGALSGVEIMYPHNEALTLWERLRRVRAPLPIGLEALEILRIEGGAPRPGLDFISAEHARDNELRRRPIEIGLDHLAPTDCAWFNGRRALKAPSLPCRLLAVLAIDADAVPAGAAVLGRKGPVGRLTSLAFSPRLKRIVAFADLDPSALGAPLAVARFGAEAEPVAARFYETPESRLAGAFRAASAKRA